MTERRRYLGFFCFICLIGKYVSAVYVSMNFLFMFQFFWVLIITKKISDCCARILKLEKQCVLN